MTVVNPKSISGINSITMASGSDNLLTIHSNNTTERVRVNNSGDVIIGSGVTLSPDGDIFATGVTTSTTFIGNLTGNVTGNASGLSGTPNISAGTIAGSTGAFTGDVSIADKIVHTGDTGTLVRFPAAGTIRFDTDSNERARIDSSGRLMLGTTTEGFAGADELTLATSGSTGITIRSGTSNDGNIYFSDGDDGSSAEYQGYVQYEHAHGRLNVGTEGTTKLKVDGANVLVSSGNLKFETSGKGIDFSATNDSSGTMSNELLADYEEGTFTCTLTGSSSNPSYTTSTNTGHYVRVGNFVSLYFLMVVNGVSGQGSGNWQVEGIPFSHSNSVNAYRSNGIIGYNDIFDFEVHKLYVTNSDKLLIIPNGVTQSNQTYSQNPLSTGYFSFSITYITDS